MTDLTPREIVSELDRYIIGQKDAKRAVAVALRNRWRRKQLGPELRDEVYPKNILMIGPTGVGKTEISRRLAKLARAPFIKVEATKFTEVGYVGRDVEQIIRDLVETAITQTREHMRDEVKAKAQANAENRVIEAIAGKDARAQTREMFRDKLKRGELDDTVIELDVADTSSPFPMMEMPGMPPGQGGMMNLGDIFGKAFGGRKVRKRLTVAESYDVLLAEEADKLLDDETVQKAALEAVQENGIVFLDEIDKVTARAETRGADVSREGRAARPPAADRRHDGFHEVRPGEDRPHPLHRLGRLPHRQALGPPPRTSGPAADPRGASRADRGRLRPHPDGDGQRPDPPVHRAHGDRRT
jgi:ATP-dependent HslUV protease ATP-binding subunit HslU